MSSFRTVDDPTRTLRVIQVGAGGMGRAWLRNLAANSDVELVGLVDLDLDGAAASAEQTGYSDLPLARSVTELAANGAVDAVINVTVPVAHHTVTTEALFLGLPVLSEKPAAPTVAEAMSLAASSEVAGELLMISQSRRYYNNLAAYRAALRELGPVSVLTNQFFKAPHFGGFREEMAYPLLVDMAIHPFDVARYLLEEDVVSVYADSFNPPWSWFGKDAAASVDFVFASGARFQYTGSWVSGGFETSWNGDWRASTAAGSALWDGAGVPQVATVDESASVNLPVFEGPEEIGGSLAEFVSALRTGKTPSGEAHDNIGSLAMVEAAILSAERGERVQIAEVLATAHETAVANEKRDAVRAVLAASAGAGASAGTRA